MSDAVLPLPQQAAAAAAAASATTLRSQHIRLVPADSSVSIDVPASVVGPVQYMPRDVATVASQQYIRDALNVKVLRNFSLRVRVSGWALQQALDKAAADVSSKPLAEDKHYALHLHNLRIHLVRGGVMISCTFAVSVYSTVTKAFGLDPHLRCDVLFPVSPLYVENGSIHVRIDRPTIAPPAEYSQAIQDAFSWVKTQVGIEARIAAALQRALDTYNGRSVVEILRETQAVDEVVLGRVAAAIDPKSACGYIVEEETGRLVLELLFTPSRRVRIAVVTAGVIGLVLVVGIIVGVAAAVTRRR